MGFFGKSGRNHKKNQQQKHYIDQWSQVDTFIFRFLATKFHVATSRL
jgi:hypothetical protein